MGWGWSSWPHTYEGANLITGNHIHDHMLVLGDGGGIYTLGAEGNLPFEMLNPQMPPKFKNTSAILPPSVQSYNYVHDAGNAATAGLDHGGIGAGSHGVGGLYTDEGSTNWNLTHNVVANVPAWLAGCRAGCPWIGPSWQNYNFYDSASKASSNVAARCPLVGDVEVSGGQWPAAAVKIMEGAGPRPRS